MRKESGVRLDKSFAQQVETLHILFENGFSDAYRFANANKRRRVIPYHAALYRRWYYSTLIENTPFTPANIMASICAHYNEGAEIYPLLSLKNRAKFNGFTIQTRSYALEAHPVVSDLTELLMFSLPHLDLQGGDYFFDEDLNQIMGRISLDDPGYAAFLLEVAIKMKLLVKIPALYVNRLEPCRDFEERINKPNADLFMEIVEAAISVSAYNLRELISLPEPVFTDSFVKGMLTDPIETDALFERVYDILGYTLEDLIELSMESENVDFDSPDGAFLAGTFLMGVVLDQHFYSVFGHYLKLIRPIFVLPFDFAGEMDDFINTRSDDADDVFVAFYAPCSNYSLTELGLRLFKVKPSDVNFYDAAKHMPFAVLKDSLFADSEMIEVLVKMAQLLPSVMADMPPREVFKFRIRLEHEPALWLHLHMPDTAHLQDIYDEAVRYFPLRDNHDYSFFHDDFENRFAEYPGPKRANPAKKKSAETPLATLDFERQNKMVLTLYNQALPFGGELPTKRLELEMMGKKPGEENHEYPRVARMSKAMQEYDEEE